MSTCKKNNRTLIIGNSRLSNTLIKRNFFPDFDLIPLRDIWAGKSLKQNVYKNIFYTSQLTRRYRNDYELLKLNNIISNFVLKSSNEESNLVFVSSIDVFGTGISTLKSELSLNPFDHYSESKVLTEKFIKKNFSKSIILRFPGMYGYDIGEESIISRMIYSLIKKKGITLTSPSIVRSILTYQHASAYIIECHNELVKRSQGNFYGILGSKKSLSLDEMANILINMKKYFGDNLSKFIDTNKDTSAGRNSKQYIKQTEFDLISYEQEDIKLGVNLFIEKLLRDGILKEIF